MVLNNEVLEILDSNQSVLEYRISLMISELRSNDDEKYEFGIFNGF